MLEARAATARSADNPIESDDEGEAADRQAEREAIAGMAAAAAGIAHGERHLGLNEKRDAGKAKQAAAAQEKAGRQGHDPPRISPGRLLFPLPPYLRERTLQEHGYIPGGS